MPFGSCSPVCLIWICFPLWRVIAADVSDVSRAAGIGPDMGPGSSPSAGVNPAITWKSHGTPPKTDRSVLQIWEMLKVIFSGSLPHWAEWTVIFRVHSDPPHQTEEASSSTCSYSSSSPSHLLHVSPLNHRLGALSVFRGLEMNEA